ncbi:DNRLRE domain-containing protein [Streptomyces sp. NBC_00536]|uniref:DNRLRE domain-containing protein n=1 Tax=Streptomyces sp. NBC_00536 TaxID=2975769 RepID=UPI002E7FE95B|nr:DNRLRE domain-containing protein [Streptomyces sp. NBC_00536]WUC78873.1 DNRLRE domain-containing protein [Streptomyces sp. NBC_00536]
MAVAVPVGFQLTKSAPEAGAEPQVDTGKPVTAAQARQRAKESGKEVEVTADRTANTTSWAQPSGQFKARVYNSPIRAKVGNDWKPIDTNLQRVEGGYTPKAVNERVVFSAGSRPATPTGTGTDGQRASRSVSRANLRTGLKTDTPAAPGTTWTDLVHLTVDGHNMVVSWPGALPEPVIDGPRALYENIRPGIDLLMTAQDGGYSHLVIVKDKQAAADPLLGELNYRLSSPDLSFLLDAPSGAVSARDAKNEEIAGAPTPYMWDSAGKIATTQGEAQLAPGPVAKDHPSLGLPGIRGAEGGHAAVAKTSLTTADNTNTLSIKPDTGLLNDADTIYPVFVDPSFKGHKHSWTLLYKTEGSSSFYNGQNYNAAGTSEARIGYESTSGGTSRSVFNFYFDSTLFGAVINSAHLRALQTYSWSCESKPFDVYSTPFINSSSTWDNTNTTAFWAKRVGGGSAGYGYNSSCPDNWVGVDIKNTITEAAANKWQAVSLGLRAPNESDSYLWKKFQANGESAPYIEVEYNKPPDTPVQSNMSTFPGGPCATREPIPKVGKTNVTFQTKATDGDGNLKQIQFRFWSADGTQSIPGETRNTNSDGVATVELAWDKFTPGKTYYWLAQAIDADGWWSGSGPNDSGGGGWCTFTVDHTAPNPPAVSSDDFPAPGPDGAEWSKNPLGPGKITVTGAGTPAADIREYQWSLNRSTYNMKTVPAAGQDTVTLDITPDNTGPNTLYVRTVNKAGNISTTTLYLFYVRPGAGQDKPGDVTGDGYTDTFAIDPAGNLRTYAGDKTGDIDGWLPGATDAGKPVPNGYWKDPATGKSALITHSTDWFPGDGLTDLIARMPDGKLYVYPGDGLGHVDISRRMEILLPAGSPDINTLTQLIAGEDVTGDGMPDFFALGDNGDTFWAFTGYTGASFSTVKQIGGAGWKQRDIVGVRDVSGDGVPDLIFRDESMANRGLALRKGKPSATGGVDLASLASEAASNGAKDITYGTTGWNRATWPLLRGVPDLTGDGIPDLYLTNTNGMLYLFKGGTTAIGGAAVGTGGNVGEDGWNTFPAIG